MGPQRGRERDDDGATRSCVRTYACVRARASMYERGLYILPLSRRQPASLVYVPALRGDTHRDASHRTALHGCSATSDERGLDGTVARLRYSGFLRQKKSVKGRGSAALFPPERGETLSHRETPETLHNAVGPRGHAGESSESESGRWARW